MTEAENEALTRVGPGSAMGRVLRQYWLPVALSEQLGDSRPVTPVEIVGEALVLFRDGEGRLGLIDRHCPHRGVDLCFGRLEARGLRCPFHGWKFDIDGQCLEQPGEPASSTMYKRVQTTAYPVIERNGIVWAFLGEGAPPAFPDLDCLRAPSSHVFAFKGLWECNWLQATEIGIDPVHASFLHRFLEDEDPADGYGKQFRDTAANSQIPMTRLLRDFPRPTLSIETTDFGMRIIAERNLGDGDWHVRVTNQIFPCAISIPMSSEINITQWHVPINDHECYWYAMFTSYGAPVDHEKMRSQRLAEHELPTYRPRKNRDNSYGYSPAEQQTLTYTGMGMDINVHDQWAVESMGSIQDRTREHLASSDKAIVAFRRDLQAALTTGISAPFAGRAGPIAIDVLTTEGERDLWKDTDMARRGQCDWDASL